MAAFIFLFASCGNEKEVRKFAEDFAEAVNDGDKETVWDMYPEEKGKSIVSEIPDDIVEIENKKDDVWRVKFSRKIWIDVWKKDKKMRVIKSKGILLENGATEAEPAGKSDFIFDDMPAAAPAAPGGSSRKLSVSNISDGPNGALGNQAGNSYHARNLFDGRSATGWAVKLAETNYAYSPYLEGPRFTVNGNHIDYIKLKNGYGKNSDSFKKNTRASWIRIYRTSGGSNPSQSDIIYEGPLADKSSAQTLSVNPSFDQSRPIGTVGLAFSSQIDDRYYHGSKWNDLVLNEIEFWGN